MVNVFLAAVSSHSNKVTSRPMRGSEVQQILVFAAVMPFNPSQDLPSIRWHSELCVSYVR
ncbi:hypothetical protein E2C01_057425 [Portunus trituberculatus]|uniref:Uncharacterized protein n=1 Tax=Portunus trituberculatus TaxID=210409 RepID=A0A5B7H1V2_PORTR|nr:hypothetical protein [Portunus trituberculatus]